MTFCIFVVNLIGLLVLFAILSEIEKMNNKIDKL
tara:strand:- start:348 stop:449 length:102 start_codon:yes stop_codon:yes gene_type:complete